MAAVSINKVTVPRSMSGYNLTDSADFTTLVSGAGNGVTFGFSSSDIVVLKNDTAGSAVYTFKVRVPTEWSTYGVTATDPTITVAAGKTVLVKLADIFKDSSGNVTIECDVAAKVLVLAG